ncbi:MAG: M20/M25/M40 family metallo-hydrolase, partial [Myxococcota bacterium]
MRRITTVGLLAMWVASGCRADSVPISTENGSDSRGELNSVVSAGDAESVRDGVWITIGTDALPVATGLVPETEGRIFVGKSRQDIAMVKIAPDLLPDLTKYMHDIHHRCAGYVVHNSRAEAEAVLEFDARAALAGKTMPSYTIDNADVVQPLINAIDERHILETISVLSSFTNRYYVTPSGVAAARWLGKLWEHMARGRSDVTVELYNHAGWPQQSVIMTIEGQTLPDEIIVIGGHLDSTSGFSPGPNTVAPGADDDASGIATLTEVARVALRSGYRPARTIKFMGYAAEEVGLRGSGEIAAAHLSQGRDVIGVLQLDMTNYHGSADDIRLVSDYTNATQNAFLGNLIDTYLGLNWGYTACGYACSDHASWHNRGFVASFPFEASLSSSNPSIHTANDTIANSGGDA